MSAESQHSTTLDAALSGWAIVREPGGAMWIGHLAGASLDALAYRSTVVLDEAYEYHSAIVVQQAREGRRVGRQRDVFPIEFFGSAPPVVVAVGAILQLADFDPEDRRTLAKTIEAGRSKRLEARAARTGLRLAVEIPKGGAA